jgi:YHS domain-containing protein
MKTRLTHGVIGYLSVAVILAATPGCRKEKPVQKESPKEEVEVREGKESAKEEVKEGVDAVTKAAVEAKLTEADEFDGKTDKVVSKCASCALGMDGKSEHALEVSGYTLHFCSEDCKTGFEKDTTKAILALKIPEG